MAEDAGAENEPDANGPSTVDSESADDEVDDFFSMTDVTSFAIEQAADGINQVKGKIEDAQDKVKDTVDNVTKSA
jgi:hypothetical protein